MSEQERKTLVCPSCGNINEYTADECLKCGLALGPVRELLAGVAVPKAEEVTPSPAEPEEPAPPMPELPARPETEEIGKYVDSWRFLIRGMGDRAEEIAARFFKQVTERDMPGVSLGMGRLVVMNESRDYYFVERYLGKEAKATMAVRIAKVGTDLFVEWRHYVVPSRYFGCSALIVLGVIALLTWGFGLLLLLSSSFRNRLNTLDESTLSAFQEQDSTAFQLAVRAALEEAIDLAGISKALIQELPKGEVEGRRVI